MKQARARHANRHWSDMNNDTFRTMKKALLGILAALLVGCALSTPYQPVNFLGRGGYLDERISDDTYRVAFYGAGTTKAPAMHAMVLYRTAEIASSRGFDYFEVLGGLQRIPMSATGGFKRVEYTVKLHKGTMPSTGDHIYSAKKVKEEIGPSIVRQ
jgi:hypothetical protein